MTHMTEAEARELTEKLLADHGHSEWKVSFGSARARAGSCNFRTHVLRLSRPLMAARTYEGTLDTIRHEVAHVIAGYQAAHSMAWRKVFIGLGGTGDRCWNPESLVNSDAIFRWAYSCSGCQRVLGQSARRRRYSDRVTVCCGAPVRSHPINHPIYRSQAAS